MQPWLFVVNLDALFKNTLVLFVEESKIFWKIRPHDPLAHGLVGPQLHEAIQPLKCVVNEI